MVAAVVLAACFLCSGVYMIWDRDHGDTSGLFLDTVNGAHRID